MYYFFSETMCISIHTIMNTAVPSSKTAVCENITRNAYFP